MPGATGPVPDLVTAFESARPEVGRGRYRDSPFYKPYICHRPLVLVGVGRRAVRPAPEVI